MNNLATEAAIRSALENLYFKGIFEGDLHLLEQVYAPGVLVVGDVKGVPYFKTRDQYLDGVRTRKSPRELGSPFQGDILSVDVINSIAIAEVTVKMYDFDYHEFLSFHELDGKWVIVNKMLTDTRS